MCVFTECNMFLSILYLLLGLALILVGANGLTDGASSLARRMGVSELVVGLTVVAMGTSTPELAISVISAINGEAGLAIGNVVGSNIFNILVIIGITALVRPIKVNSGIMTKELPLVVLSSLVLLVMANGPWLDVASTSIITRVDGLLLLLFFAIFMRYTFSQAKNGEISDSQGEPVKEMPVWKAVAWVLGGLTALVYGGDRFVAGASDIASAMGVSQEIIGLTIVAMGTSLPELATSVVAAVKGRPGIALGNVVGSNIFNIFLVLGSSATITQLPMGGIGNFDLLTLLVSSLLFWLFGWLFPNRNSARNINRVEGALLATCYIAYVTILILKI